MKRLAGLFLKMKSENFKVGVAAMLGFGSPAANLVLENLEPVLKILLLTAQVGVAVVTILFIHRKWQNAGKKPAQKPRRKPRRKA